MAAPSLAVDGSTKIKTVEQAYEVTSVGVNPAADRAHRMRVYFIAMSVRIACVASLFFVRGWWILLVGLAAVILPYFAVLVANQAEHRSGPGPETPTPLELTGAAPTAPREPVSDPARELLVVDAPAERRSTARPTAEPGATPSPGGPGVTSASTELPDTRPASGGDPA